VDGEGAPAVAAAARRWLTAGRDVLLRGDRGLGKSTALEALRAELSDRRVVAVLVRAAGPTPFSAVLDHPSAPVRVPDETALAAWLAAEVAAPRSVLLVDDVDRLDPGSLRVVRRALARSGCRLVATTTADPLRLPASGARELFVDRAPHEVRVLPLGLAGMAALLTGALDAPVDGSLTSSVATLTGGNPGVAQALVAAARVSGRLRRRDGHYVDDGRLAEVPADAVVLLLLGGADERATTALEALAAAGPVDSARAALLADPAVLAELVEAGRLAEHRVAGLGSVLVVAPPVLARALRDRATAARRVVLGAGRAADGTTDRTRDGAADGSRVDGTGLAALLDADDDGQADYLRWTAAVAGLAHERTVAAEAARRATWLGAPTLRNANEYLALLMRRPAREQLAAVFRDTAPGPDDTAEDRLVHRYYAARWESWAGVPGQDGYARALLDDPAARPLLALDGLKERLVAAIRDGEPAEQVAASTPAAAPTPLVRGADAVVRAGALLEAGRPDLALAVVGPDPAGDRGAPVGDGPAGIGDLAHYRAALRAESLLLLGRTDQAEQQERRLLSAAYDASDVLGIRVHACVLAEVLAVQGRVDPAWRTLATALRLGPTGPVETTYHRRGLALATVLQAGRGHLTLARALLRELDRAPRVHQPVVRSMRVLAHLAVGLATGDRTGAPEVAWRAGAAYAEQGLAQPALLTWTFAVPPLSPERAALVRSTRRGTVLPALDPYLDLQLALADDDREAAADALTRVQPGLAPTLVRAAHAHLGTLDLAPPEVRGPVEPLTARERQIALLAHGGRSNREIADQLHLSVRTVENHMSRALRKLGYRDRAGLLAWSDA
jgi:DNA-binding CsgD family transcriptional regulator